MSKTRRAELVVGVFTFLMGLIGAIYLWIAPVFSFQGRVIDNATGRIISDTHTNTSLSAFVGPGAAIALIVTLAILALWVLLAAIRSSALMAWLAVVALVVYSFATALVFPDAPLLLAVLAAAGATITTMRRVGSRLAQPL